MTALEYLATTSKDDFLRDLANIKPVEQPELDPDPDEILYASDVADILNLSVSSLSRKSIPWTYDTSGRRTITRVNLQRWEEANSTRQPIKHDRMIVIAKTDFIADEMGEAA